MRGTRLSVSGASPPNEPSAMTVRLTLSVAAFVSALIFAGLGMWLPPRGRIDASILILVAQLLVLCATFLGIKDYTNIINKKQ